ncbi:hypothetical protein ACWEQL_38640 [Kitasatospora sp. NPDC004240]
MSSQKCPLFGVKPTSMLALHLLQSALMHVNALLLRQGLAGPKWARNSPPGTGAG